jgi:hypothetical protein
MSHPFEVGKTYRNRVGEYVVQSVEGDRMTIRYVNGGTLTTSVRIQARIWENIHFEEQMVREDERRRLAREARIKVRKQAARAKQAQAMPKFGGFKPADFEPANRGIAWKTRKEAGTFLAFTMGKNVGLSFDSWIVPRQSRVHVAQGEHYDKEVGERNAAFFVAVDESGVTYGLCVGNPDGKAKANWPWSALLAAMSDDDKVRRAIRAAMKAYDLALDVYAMDVRYGLAGQATHQDRGFLWEEKTADQEVSRKMDWNDLVERLQSLADGKRCNVFFQTKMPAREAIKSGAEATAQIIEVFEALMPVYESCVSV